MNNLEKDENLNAQTTTKSKAKIELSAMAVVICNHKILTITELIYGKKNLSLPKGHKEPNESIVETAIRECFEETNIVILQENLVKPLTPFSYEFLTPEKVLIKKTVMPFLFKTNDEGNPMPKEEKMLAVEWMNVNEFLQICTHTTAKKLIEEAFS